MSFVKLADLPRAVYLNGSGIMPITNGGTISALSINDLKEKIKDDIVKEMAAEKAKEVSGTAAVALGAGFLVAKSPPVTRRFLRMFGK